MKTMVGVVVLAGIVVVSACSKDSEKSTASEEPTAAVAPTPAVPPREPSPLEKVVAAESLADAIAAARPMMTDTMDETSAGMVALSLWAGRKLRWSELEVKKNETSFARVRKDSDSSRGKRMCMRGRIIQITKDASAGVAIYFGLMLIGYSEIARFAVVGDTGELVERSRARLCGVVIGTYDYSNSAGGTGHAVALVGMFDLPANRAQ